jgi:hypothetical protein
MIYLAFFPFQILGNLLDQGYGNFLMTPGRGRGHGLGHPFNQLPPLLFRPFQVIFISAGVILFFVWITPADLSCL